MTTQPPSPETPAGRRSSIAPGGLPDPTAPADLGRVRDVEIRLAVITKARIGDG
ncbi:MAG: hypothetical protein ACRDS9_17440 [Pseudonocardiaceae bacterium]